MQTIANRNRNRLEFFFGITIVIVIDYGKLFKKTIGRQNDYNKKKL